MKAMNVIILNNICPLFNLCDVFNSFQTFKRMFLAIILLFVRKMDVQLFLYNGNTIEQNKA